MAARRHHISFGLVDERPIFMDERSDSYFLIDGDLEARFLKLLRNSGGSPLVTDELRETLGLDSDGGSLAIARCEPAGRSLMQEPCPRDRARLLDALALARILQRTRRSLQSRPIEQILAELLAPHGATVGHDPQPQLIERARRFRAVRRWCL